MLDYSFERTPQFEDLQPLMNQTSWMGDRGPAGVVRMLQASVVLSVWSGNRLVGFGRAITDHVYRAFIEDIVVDEAHRHKGVGSEIMSRLIEHLQDVEEIQLGCVDELVSFYGALGFQRSSQPKMILRRP